MIRKEWDNVLNSLEVRQSLSKIRQAIKNQDEYKKLQEIAAGNEEVLIKQLQSEDAKTRKNAALLMGDLAQQIYLEPIWQAYTEESQRFVKSSYLSAIGEFDYREYMQQLKEQLEQLENIELTAENEKHIAEEMRELSALIIRIEGIASHTFTGWSNPANVILMTSRNFTNNLGKEIMELEPGAEVKSVGAGVLATVENLNWIRAIRTYQEILFMVEGMKTCKMEPAAVADNIVASGLLKFLTDNHDKKAPFYFRLEMRVKKSLGEKSVFLKKLAARIEKLSNRKLINSTDNYEFEIRLIENKQQNCNILIKLFTLKDHRFTYRNEFMPTSIKPVNAALTVALAKEFMKEDAQVLDPFCGVGTMLIERHKAVQANTMYGIDIQEEAITKAAENTKTAGQIAHYINRDFFTFTHDYLFDEIITDMPFKIGRTSDEDIFLIYKKFFVKAPEHLNEGAIVILYSHDRRFVKQMVLESEFKIMKEHEISKKEETYVFVLKYR